MIWFLGLFIAASRAEQRPPAVYSYGECVVIVEDQGTHPNIMLKRSAESLGLIIENESLKVLLPPRRPGIVEVFLFPEVTVLSRQDREQLQSSEVVVKWAFFTAGAAAMMTNYAGPGLALVASGVGVHIALSWAAVRYRSELLQRQSWVRGHKEHCITSSN